MINRLIFRLVKMVALIGCIKLHPSIFEYFEQIYKYNLACIMSYEILFCKYYCQYSYKP